MRTMHRFILALALWTGVAGAIAADGLVVRTSPYSAKETMGRVEEVVRGRKLVVFAWIDHAAGAAKIGRSLRPTQLLIFGNPQGGTPLMECAQSAGIDLPLKMLAWEDAQGVVWLGYNDPAYLAARHGAAGCAGVENLGKALAEIAAQAVAK